MRRDFASDEEELAYLIATQDDGDYTTEADSYPTDPNKLVSRLAIPMTPTEALMSAEPNAEPQGSTLDGLHLRELIADAFDQLSDDERAVVEAVVIGRMSMRGAARQEWVRWACPHRVSPAEPRVDRDNDEVRQGGG